MAETQEVFVARVAITVLDPSEAVDPAEFLEDVANAVSDGFPDDGYVVVASEVEEAPTKFTIGATVKPKGESQHYGQVWGAGIIDQGGKYPPHQVVRVAWANDAVLQVPVSLQYADDLEEVQL